MWRKKPDNWPEVNRDPEELPYMNDLTGSLWGFPSLGGTPTPFPSGCAALPCFCLNKLFLCVLSHLLCCVSNNKLCTCFYSFASVTNAFFTGGNSQRVWWLGFLVFIQAPQVQFPGREVRSRFTPPLTAATLRSGGEAEVSSGYHLFRSLFSSCPQSGPTLQAGHWPLCGRVNRGLL